MGAGASTGRHASVQQKQKYDAIIQRALEDDHANIGLLEEAITIAIDFQNYKLAAQLTIHTLADGKLLYFALQHIQKRSTVENILQFLYQISAQDRDDNYNKRVEQFMECMIYGLRMNNIDLLKIFLCKKQVTIFKYIHYALKQPLPEELYNSHIIRKIAIENTDCIPCIKTAALCAAIKADNVTDANAIVSHLEPAYLLYPITKIIRDRIIVCISPLVLAKGALLETLESIKDSDYISAMKAQLNDAIENDYIAFVQYVAEKIDDTKILEENILVDHVLLVGPIEYAIHLKRKEIVLILTIRYGVNRVNRLNATPLFYAIETENDEMVSFLIEECKADINAPIYFRSEVRTPFMQAVKLYNYNAMRIIATAGGEVDSIIDGKSALSFDDIDLEYLPMVTVLLQEYNLVPTPADTEYLIKLAVWAIIHDDAELALTLTRKYEVNPQRIQDVYDALRVYPSSIEFKRPRNSEKLNIGISKAELSRQYTLTSTDQLETAALHYYVTQAKPRFNILEVLNKGIDAGEEISAQAAASSWTNRVSGQSVEIAM